MLKLLKLFGWVVFTGILLVAIDQFLVRVPIALPGVTPAQTFYVDFRSRILDLIGMEQFANPPGRTIEQVIEATKDSPAVKNSAVQRYLYVDDSGALQFADGLDLVPARYRQSAQPLAE